MNVDINKFNEIYPEFAKNVTTWVSYKYYRQIPLSKLKRLEEFLNEVEGKKIYNCTSCNIGNMLKKLYEIKQYVDNKIKEQDENNKIKEQNKNDEELIQTNLFKDRNNDIKKSNKNTQQQNIKKNNKKTKK